MKHKLSNENQNTHHLDIFGRIEFFGDYFIDENAFIAGILVSDLLTKIFKKSFYSLFEFINNHGVNGENFFDQFEIIITDFSNVQYNGISHAMRLFL